MYRLASMRYISYIYIYTGGCTKKWSAGWGLKLANPPIGHDRRIYRAYISAPVVARLKNEIAPTPAPQHLQLPSSAPAPHGPSPPRLSSLLLAAPQPPLYISGTSISVWQRGRFSLIAPILSFVQVSKVHAIVWYAYSIRASILRPQPFNTIRSVPVFSPTFVRRYIDTSVGGTSLTPCHFVSRLDWRLSNPRPIDRWLVNDRNR